jgi:hypothetical protein
VNLCSNSSTKTPRLKVFVNSTTRTLPNPNWTLSMSGFRVFFGPVGAHDVFSLINETFSKSQWHSRGHSDHSNGPEAAASWAACVSLDARQSPQSSLPASRLSTAARSSGRLAADRSLRRCRLARTRPEKPVRAPGGGGRLGCSRLSRLPPVAPGHRSSRRSSCPCSAPDVAPSRPSTVCGRRTPESALRAAAAARLTTGRFQRLSGMVRISDVPHRTKTARTIPP